MDRSRKSWLMPIAMSMNKIRTAGYDYLPFYLFTTQQLGQALVESVQNDDFADALREEIKRRKPDEEALSNSTNPNPIPT